MSQSLHLTTRGSVLEIILDRPKANAIDAKTSHEMGEIFMRFRIDPSFTRLPLLQVLANDSFVPVGI